MVVTSTGAIRNHQIEVDGQRLALRSHPAADGARCAVLLPAMGVPAAYYDPFAAVLATTGLRVVVADLRGTGASGPPATRASRYGYRELAGDVELTLAMVAELFPGPAPLLIGHSLGGHAAALHLALSPTADGVAGLVLLATGTPYHRCYPGLRGAGVRSAARLVRTIAGAVGWWPGDRLGFGGRQASGVMRDWAYLVRTGRFPTVDGADPETAMATVGVPVLAISVAGDRYTPGQTLDHLCAKLSAAPVIRHHYTRTESGAVMDHFRWTRAGSALADRIGQFASRL